MEEMKATIPSVICPPEEKVVPVKNLRGKVMNKDASKHQEKWKSGSATIASVTVHWVKEFNKGNYYDFTSYAFYVESLFLCADPTGTMRIDKTRSEYWDGYLTSKINTEFAMIQSDHDFVARWTSALAVRELRR
jgi:hypothetical protein